MDVKTGMDVEIRNTVDCGIIGGVIIKIGDKVIDSSVKGKINDLKAKLESIELKGEDFGIEN